MSQKVIIIGGVGTGTIIAQAILDANKRGDSTIELAGFMSHDKCEGDTIEGIKVFVSQSKENVLKYHSMGYKYIYALHRMDGGDFFIDMYHDLGLTFDMMATFVHPMAYVAPNVIVKSGAVVMPYAMISAATVIDHNALLMTGVTVGHNSHIGIFNHIASQAVVGSYVHTSLGAHVGLNATIREYLTIGEYSTIGMGAVLTRSVGNKEVWVGNPAKFMRNTK